jgi:hypothetical protein
MLPCREKIWHPYWRWECYVDGFYADPADDASDAEKSFSGFFTGGTDAFRQGIRDVFSRWPISCEHFLTWKEINRVAWLGQAAVFIGKGIVQHYKYAFASVSENDRRKANDLARHAIICWTNNGKW